MYQHKLQHVNVILFRCCIFLRPYARNINWNITDMVSKSCTTLYTRPCGYFLISAVDSNKTIDIIKYEVLWWPHTRRYTGVGFVVGCRRRTAGHSIDDGTPRSPPQPGCPAQDMGQTRAPGSTCSWHHPAGTRRWRGHSRVSPVWALCTPGRTGLALWRKKRYKLAQYTLYI